MHKLTLIQHPKAFARATNSGSSPHLPSTPIYCMYSTGEPTWWDASTLTRNWSQCDHTYDLPPNCEERPPFPHRMNRNGPRATLANKQFPSPFTLMISGVGCCSMLASFANLARAVSCVKTSPAFDWTRFLLLCAFWRAFSTRGKIWGDRVSSITFLICCFMGDTGLLEDSVSIVDGLTNFSFTAEGLAPNLCILFLCQATSQALFCVELKKKSYIFLCLHSISKPLHFYFYLGPNRS